MTPEDYLQRLNFALWHIQQTANSQTFHADALFKDKATFMEWRMFNIHNFRLLAHINPRGKITHAYQKNFSFNV